MTAKKQPRWHARATKSVRAHPWLTWATLASIATVLAVVLPALGWLSGHYQTVEAAELHAQKDLQAQTTQMYETQSIKSLILGNRVIACRTKGKDAPDKATCAQAELDYQQSIKRENDLYREVRKAAK